MTATPPHPTGTPRRTAGFVLMVGLLTLLPAVTTDMYLPSLPDVARDLSTNEAGAQFTITGMLIGGAIGQLIVGPFSDRVGRRLPVLIGVGLHVLISLTCVFVTTITQLATLRVLQGLVSAGATVVAMAVVRDRYSGAEAARIISRLMLVIAAAPLLAPTVGSVIAEIWDWRAVFVALALVALVILLAAARFLPETLPAERRTTQGITTSLRGYLELVRDGRFVALAVIPGLSMALIMSYVAGSPFVLQEGYGLTSQQFAIAFAVGGTSLVAGSQLNAALVRRVGPVRLLRLGLPATAAVAGFLVPVTVLQVGGVAGFVGTLWVCTALLGFVMANASALALTRHGERAGTAAAVIGFMQAGLAGLVSPLVGLFGGGAGAMTGVMFGSMLLALVILAFATPAYRPGGWVELGGEPVGTPAPH
ncbi:multidrug effflux MFS transporter [Cellulomonas bogoriensis]|uniref:Transporter n=1 Tax=Cellulomonas bogoriensis 69B4 = DSM 16987 TaxID=1386082 RepID=A0A0A0BWT2_9CELL|nr:multidrug effflux MFS transporter [Cellulomonas bogoriensis]KGM12838.1 transporter [Cellulomonas bogoriensis 69B4 = DSM 16987]